MPSTPLSSSSLSMVIATYSSGVLTSISIFLEIKPVASAVMVTSPLVSPRILPSLSLERMVVSLTVYVTTGFSPK